MVDLKNLAKGVAVWLVVALAIIASILITNAQDFRRHFLFIIGWVFIAAGAYQQLFDRRVPGLYGNFLSRYDSLGAKSKIRLNAVLIVAGLVFVIIAALM